MLYIYNIHLYSYYIIVYDCVYFPIYKQGFINQKQYYHSKIPAIAMYGIIISNSGTHLAPTGLSFLNV